MPRHAPPDDVLLRRVVRRCPGLLATVTELRDVYRWTLSRIAKALDRDPIGLLRAVSAEAHAAGPVPLVRVVCLGCRWARKRPRATATLRPCPHCGGGVRMGRMRPGRPSCAETMGVQATLQIHARASPRALRMLRELAGQRTAEAIGMLLERWAAGEAIPAGWRPPLVDPPIAKRRNRRVSQRESLLQRVAE